MVIEEFAQLLDGRVVDEVPPRRWRRVPRHGGEGLPQVLRRRRMRDGGAQPLGQGVAPRLLLGEVKVMGEPLLLVLGVGVGDQPVHRAEGFGEGRAFQAAPARGGCEPRRTGSRSSSRGGQPRSPAERTRGTLRGFSRSLRSNTRARPLPGPLTRRESISEGGRGKRDLARTAL
jgi:hypothetical protein